MRRHDLQKYEPRRAGRAAAGRRRVRRTPDNNPDLLTHTSIIADVHLLIFFIFWIENQIKRDNNC